MAYIDVDKFAEKICNFQAIDEDSANAVIYLLRSQPTADVEEVVRCKDCKHGHWNQETCHGKPIYYCDRTDLQVSKYSFCSYGERRTDNAL